MGRALEKRLQKLEHARSAAKALDSLCAPLPALAALELREALAIKPDAVVFRADWQGRTVVLKRFLTNDAAAIITRMQAEIDYAAAQLADPRFGVNRCLLALPEQGLILLDHVPGQRLRDSLAAAPAAERARLLRLAADWLAAYTAPRREIAGFGARHWARRARATDISHLSAADQALATRLIAAIAERALAARGARLVRSLGHGDFVDLNLMHDGERLCGVDIQGPALLPIARMVARFLVWHQLQSDSPDEPRESGIDKRDLDAFLGGGLLSEAERSRLLPVFVGDQLLLRFCESYHAHKHRSRAIAAIESYLGSV